MPDLTQDLTPEQKIALNIVTLNTAINTLQEHDTLMQKIVIQGNGELPLREQVRNHEKFIGDIRYWSKFFFGALIVQTIAFTGGIIVAVVRFLPLLERLAK